MAVASPFTYSMIAYTGHSTRAKMSSMFTKAQKFRSFHTSCPFHLELRTPTVEGYFIGSCICFLCHLYIYIFFICDCIYILLCVVVLLANAYKNHAVPFTYDDVQNVMPFYQHYT